MPARAQGGVCHNLASIRHQLQCCEQVVLADGTTMSKKVAQSLVLTCTAKLVLDPRRPLCRGAVVQTDVQSYDPCPSDRPFGVSSYQSSFHPSFCSVRYYTDGGGLSEG